MVKAIFKIVAEETGEDTNYYEELITYVQDRPGHDYRYAIDSSKIRRELGWNPRETFLTGLRKTVKWYLNNIEWVNSVKIDAYRKWIKQIYGNIES